MAKKFPQSYPTDSAALENRKNDGPPNFLFGKIAKLDRLRGGGGGKVQRRHLDELIFRILRI